MDKTFAVVSSIPLFNGLSAGQVEAITAIATEKRYARNQTVFSEGEPARGFYIIAEGKVKIFKLSLDGKEQILHIYGPGDPFGEVPMFAGGKFPANAQALVASRLIFLPRRDFARLLAVHPSLAMNMLAVLSRRLREFTVQIENLSLKEVPGRLAAYLLYLSTEQDDSDRVQLPISKGQLASLLGTIPETLSRIFAKMTDQGMINVQGRRITIANRQAMEELALEGRLAV